jgi:D-glycero-alpha-D-manno-heptose 1-phosphate guanylyltransferase
MFARSDRYSVILKPLIVLAGGFGTRLRSVVKDLPKPLAPIHGEPFLQFLMDNWIRQGVQEFVFSLHFQAESISEFLLEAYPDVKIRTVVEPVPLGTGGAVKYAIDKLALEGSFLVANADTWLSNGVLDIQCMEAPSISLVAVDDVGRYGAVEVNDGFVSSFSEKGSNGAGLVNAGVYHLAAEHFDGFGPKFSLETSVLAGLVDKSTLKACVLSAEFVDIGVPSDYEKFCGIVANRQLENSRDGV